MKKSNQHYVPRSILRNFTNPNTVFCLMSDQNGKIISSTVENLCAEKEFYCFSLDIDDEDTGETLDYDKQVFDEVDRQIAPIVKKVISQHNVDMLTDSERKFIAKYIVYQYFRSPAAKNVAISLSTDQKSARQIQGLNLLDSEFIEHISDIINGLRLRIVEATEGNEFIISDSPVLWSPTADGIYFPISPNYCLCYQKSDIVPLDSICINDLELRASSRFNIAQNKDTLENIWQNTYQKHITEFCNTGNPSYWKCILKNNDSLNCIKSFKEDIYEEFKVLIN